MGLTSFQKGIDFMRNYRGREFTTKDIARRYDLSCRQASRLRGQANVVLGLAPAGFRGKEFLWKIRDLTVPGR